MREWGNGVMRKCRSLDSLRSLGMTTSFRLPSSPHSRIPSKVPTPRQERPEHSRAQRRMRDPQLFRRAEQEARLETDVDPVRGAEALRDAEAGDPGREPELAGHVPVRR